MPQKDGHSIALERKQCKSMVALPPFFRTFKGMGLG
jgi:hypothetical protein